MPIPSTSSVTTWFVLDADVDEDLFYAWAKAVEDNQREKLTANRTYYVRTDGSDSNDGRTNTAGGSFLTIQKAIDVVYGTLDLNAFKVTIQVGAGTWSELPRINARPLGNLAFDAVTILGDPTTPTNCVLSGSSASGTFRVNAGSVQINGFYTTAATQPHLFVTFGELYFANMVFGATTSNHIVTSTGGYIQRTGNYTISGGAARHIRALLGGGALISGGTVTLTGTPAFSTAFVVADSRGYISAGSTTYSGAATGVRYIANTTGFINTNGAGATYFPGGTAGTADAATFGLYA